MKDQLISFETAKLAKEKGFFWYTQKCFDVQNNNNIADTGEIVNLYSRVGNLSAPTQSLLQKWLREKWGIIVVSLPWKDHQADNNDPITFRAMIYRVKTYEEHTTYEDALEQGLFEALKLIP